MTKGCRKGEEFGGKGLRCGGWSRDGDRRGGEKVKQGSGVPRLRGEKGEKREGGKGGDRGCGWGDD